MTYYKIELEIYEGNGGKLHKDGDEIIYPDLAKEGICAWMYRGDGKNSYQQGQRFNYPEDLGKLCPWLIPWKYENTPYEKEIDPSAVTTEFIRCVDPTDSGIVVKIIRTLISD